jgi:hypothetical protein
VNSERLGNNEKREGEEKNQAGKIIKELSAALV